MLRITAEIVRTQVFGDHGRIPFLGVNSKLKDDIERWQGIKVAVVRNASQGRVPTFPGLPPTRSRIGHRTYARSVDPDPYANVRISCLVN